MMTKTNLIKLFIVLLFTLTATTTMAQVTIGSGIEPSRGALLDLKENENLPANSQKGLLFPKVSLVSRTSLVPLFQSPLATVQEQEMATGMVVYNVSSTIEEGPGLYVWNGTEWHPLMGSNSGYATFDPIDCDKVEVQGYYTVEDPLNGNTNYLSMQVTVSHPGIYIISANASPHNGYYFFLTGEFLMEGKYYIQVPALGTPLAAKQENNPDVFTINVNGQDVCTKNVVVQNRGADFRLICESITVNGTYSPGITLTGDNFMQVRITAPQSAAGAEYTIKTDEVNGYSFAAKGKLNGGSQIIDMEGNGQPVNVSTDYFTISTNSINANVTCNKAVTVASRQIKILGLGSAWYNVGNPAANPGASMNKLLTNPNLFGNTENALFPVAGFTFLSSGGYLPGNAALATMIQTNLPDIIITGHDYYPDDSQASMATLLNFVNKGGVLIFCSDGDGVNSLRNRNANYLIQNIFGDNTLATTAQTQGNDTYPFTSDFQEITSGIFGSLTNRNIQRDVSNQFEVDLTSHGGVMPNGQVLVYKGLNGRAVVHNTQGFMFVGDGGVFAGATDQIASTTSFPLKVERRADNYYYPKVHTNNSANAFLFCNVMSWAINLVNKNRPTGTESYY